MRQKVSQITVRGFDADLEQALRRLAEREGISLNRAALRLLRRGAGLSPEGQGRDRVGDRLDHLAGTWSEEEERELSELLEDTRSVDEELWR